ncbi:non-ribosomal peptide synthetase [Mastigocladopsis repens]|uniref:non-ribosomal peptide synthetase n=1 Tax=Mastigocladopsis repens TaxID=221287 RepID=UPI0002EE8F66|nr:non-ribosomal peptide synthetase [Mastigocladopsis repens]
MLSDLSGFRLSPQQKRLWLLQQESSTYVAQCAILIEGTLQKAVLKTALEKIINRHNILRTAFQSLSSLKMPIMVIQNSYDFSWCEIKLDERLTKASIESICQEERKQAFDFERAVLLRASLLRMSATKHILLITLPSLCADAWTLKNLFQEISEAYYAFVNGEEICEEAVQYIQFSEWQNQLLAEPEVETGKDYWCQQDFSALKTLKLPFEDKADKKAQFQLEYLNFEIAPRLTANIKSQVQQSGTSVADFLLSCWQILLWRLTGQSEMIIGTVYHGREYEELNDVLGLFAKSLPIPCHLISDLRFSEVIKQVSKATQDAYEWQEYFFVEQIDSFSGNLAGFPIVFEYEELPEKLFTGDISFSFYNKYICTERFKIKLFCLDKGNSLDIGIYYDANLLSADTIRRLAEQFQTLLASVTENPDVAISQLEILPQSQVEQLLIKCNQTQVDYSQNKCIHQIFEAQAACTPDNVAVVFEEQQLTYAELNSRANQLAHYLRRLGVKPEILVGICLERTHLMLVAMLGILKAGGAYLPLDPALPQESLTFRLQDAQVPILLTQQTSHSIQQAKSLSQSECQHTIENTALVFIDTDWEIIAQENTDNISSEVTPENLVYVLYTSGSTGKPKGVAVEHRQLLNYLYGILPKLDLPTDASFAIVSTFAADLGNTVIFPCLCSGGCLHVVSWERASDPTALAAYFRRYPIDCLKIVPSHLAALLSSDHIEFILPRQLLILGGEVTDWHLIETIQQYAPHCRIINHYGPTETTVGVLTYTVTRKTSETTVPIGRPIANTQVYVLDSYLKPVPIGVPGELYISGESLARGYLNRPELTVERFITNPFSKNYSQRLYRTGDLVRYLPDENLEFLGRLDEQVKIRGFRIELGEISAALSQHPAVHEVVVITEEVAGEKRLVAYTVPTSASSIQHSVLIHDLRNFLKEKLLEYMIPSAFVILKALPLTPNGKVDRNALPAPDEAVATQRNFVIPRTPVEEVLAGIWAQLLFLQKVSIEDNFFDLGGHSLVATQVISRLRTTFGVELPLRQLFESPTVAELAEHIERAMRVASVQEITSIGRVSKDRELPLSFAQKRLWFLDQLEPANPTYNLQRAIRLTGSLNIAAFRQSFSEILQRHEVLRTRFAINERGNVVQIITPAQSINLPVLDLQKLSTTQQEAEIQRLIQQEGQQGFDLANGPLLRTTLVQLGKQEYVLLFTMHHIVSDAWSTGVLARELTALYEAFSQSKPSPLQELPIQYADFALWQQEWFVGERLTAQLDYWKQQLAGDLPVLALPTDRPRPAVQTFAGQEYDLVLPHELSQALKVLSQQEGVTLFMTLLAAFKTLLYRYTGQEDILIGSPIANRNRAEIEHLIGFFVNTLVLRTDLSGNLSFRELLKRVREVTLGAYAHQDLPFEKLVEELQPQRDMSRPPLFQVMFVFQNAPTETLDLPGLSIQPMPLKSKTAKFDLALSLVETEQGLLCKVEYNTDLFEEFTISRLIEHFQILLTGIVANPQQRLWELPLLTATEQQQLVEWNNTYTNYDNERCLHQLFEAQVEQTPDAVAVVFEDEQLTYRELNQRANQLAHHLQKLGVKPEVLVGICVERSLEMVIGLLGILKAGGAYVPLDPSYPRDRLAFMFENSQTPVLLTQQHLLENLPAHTAKVVCLDSNWEVIARASSENPICNLTPDNLAYVIYTSGSTGRPKGAMNTHRGICNRLLWMQSAYQLTAADRVLQKTPFSFDVSVWEFFWTLLTGARLVVAQPEGHRDPNYLVKLILQQQITTVHFVPSMLQVFLETEGLETCKCLKRVIASGEALPVELQKRFFTRLDAQLHNLYGPTEAAIDVTFWECVPENTHWQKVPIGRPIANTQIYLLDQHLYSVPLGVIGELYIGGVAVGRGYLNSPELTAEKFIPNHFSDEPGARLYKTGDKARYLADGNIEFLGRIDDQVKIRGFRIELGEIEAAITQHPTVRECVVVVREDELAQKCLVAYVVLYSEQTLTSSELRHFLELKLPGYMVPSAFVMLQALPLTPNGKVNRRVLPAPENLRPELEVAYVMPQTEVERAIATVWQKALNLENIGIHDNFFELGGHSLLMVRVHRELREIFKTDLSLLNLFRYSTISSLAEFISQGHQKLYGNETDHSTEIRTAGKAQQKKRLQKIKTIRNI